MGISLNLQITLVSMDILILLTIPIHELVGTFDFYCLLFFSVFDGLPPKSVCDFYFFNLFFIIHMCIQGLGHFSPLPPTPPLPPTLPPPSPHISFFIALSFHVKSLLQT
jgi:hypothetical protein